MKIKDATFLISTDYYDKCPPPTLPEYAFIGRSNVGKSSLINMLVAKKGLAKTSSTPGKTQTINVFKINNNFFLTDLPGYGYAKISRTARQKWEKMISNYIVNRKNLMCLFVLVDSRIPPQDSDINFINNYGADGIPIVIVFTKTDKQGVTVTQSNVAKVLKQLKNSWEELPPYFLTSAESKKGREELLKFIEDSNANFELIP